jgi:hypothetical protein
LRRSWLSAPAIRLAVENGTVCGSREARRHRGIEDRPALRQRSGVLPRLRPSPGSGMRAGA